jgi:hypothetical protein
MSQRSLEFRIGNLEDNSIERKEGRFSVAVNESFRTSLDDKTFVFQGSHVTRTTRLDVTGSRWMGRWWAV